MSPRRIPGTALLALLLPAGASATFGFPAGGSPSAPSPTCTAG